MIQRFGFCCKWLNDTSEFGGMKVNAKDLPINLSSLRSVSPRRFLVESPLLSLTGATRAARRFACAISPLHSAPPVVPRRL